MTVQPEKAAGSHVHEGQTLLLFAWLLGKFREDPSHYLTPSAQRTMNPMAVPTGATVEYICPMDPEILETKPGACPICGMALEPRVVSVGGGAESGASRYDETVLDQSGTGPAGDDAGDGRHDSGPATPADCCRLGRNWIQWLLATPVVLWGGWPFFERAWTSIVNKAPNMFTLIGMGTGAAYLYSS